QAAARLHQADVARGAQVAPPVPVQRLVTPASHCVSCQAGVAGRGLEVEAQARWVLRRDDGVVVQYQVARRLLRLARVAGDAATLEDRLDVAVVLHALRTLLVTQARLLLRVPLLAGLVAHLRCNQRRAGGQVEGDVIGLCCGRLREVGRLLAV